MNMDKVKMASMKRTAADKRQDKMEQAGAEAMMPDYPWGTCIHLDKDECDKIGMKTMPDVGDTFMMCAKVKVTRVSQSAAEGAEDQSSVDLQITDMGMVAE